MQIHDIWFQLKDGRKALLRSPKEEDAKDILQYLMVSTGETEFILRYPEECSTYTLEYEKKLCNQKNASENEALLVCLVDGKLIGSGEIAFHTGIKTRHRATIAIALLKAYWDRGIGTRMLQELIHLAEKRGGIMQVELEFVEGNSRARYLYEKMGFRITGIRPDAIKLKDGTLLHEYMMIKKIDKSIF